MFKVKSPDKYFMSINFLFFLIAGILFTTFISFIGVTFTPILLSFLIIINRVIFLTKNSIEKLEIKTYSLIDFIICVFLLWSIMLLIFVLINMRIKTFLIINFTIITVIQVTYDIIYHNFEKILKEKSKKEKSKKYISSNIALLMGLAISMGITYFTKIKYIFISVVILNFIIMYIFNKLRITAHKNVDLI